MTGFPSGLDPERMQVEAAPSSYQHTKPGNERTGSTELRGQSLAEPAVCWIKPYLRLATSGPFCQMNQ